MTRFKKCMSIVLVFLMCLTTLCAVNVTDVHGVGETSKAIMISYPRESDMGMGNWGHTFKSLMNGWKVAATEVFNVHAQGSFSGQVCYCIEPGVSRHLGDIYTSFGENFWDDLSSTNNTTIDSTTIKLLLGRIMQYGYQGNISSVWSSQNAADVDKLGHIMATQILIWETIVGERDANFEYVSAGKYDTVKSMIDSSNPCYERFIYYYDFIVSAVKNHTLIPSFMANNSSDATEFALEWNGSEYSVTLTDTNHVLSKYSFSSDVESLSFSKSGNQLTITTSEMPDDVINITAAKSQQRKGVLVWSDAKFGPDQLGIQDVITYSASVSDSIKAYAKVKSNYGSIKIVKTSEDQKVEGVSFTVVDPSSMRQNVVTDSNGVVQIDHLEPGVYSVIETIDAIYVPQEAHSVTVVAGKVSTVTFNNTLKRGTLTVTKTSEDHVNEGVKFHLYGTSSSGLAVDEYAVTDENGVAVFDDVLIGTNYTLEEVEVASRYVEPSVQSVSVTWKNVTYKDVYNALKKFKVTVTKIDTETNDAQGDATVAGAKYGIYKGGKLIDTYLTDENGQFTTSYYVCGDDWTICEIEPSKGYLLDATPYKIASEVSLYTKEYNSAKAFFVLQQVKKGKISIMKYKDNEDGVSNIPVAGAQFEVYLQSALSYCNAKETERDLVASNENGLAVTKSLPYGKYVIKEVSAPEGYVLDETLHTVVIDRDDQAETIHIGNCPVRGTVELTKFDADYPENKLSGAEFKVYKDEEFVGLMEEVADGVYQLDDLLYGKYTLKEVKAPEGFYLDSNVYEFAIKENGVTVVVENEAGKGFLNNAMTGSIQIHKTSEDGVLAGFRFKVEGNDITGHNFSKEYVTDENGLITIEGLRVGDYVVSEVADKSTERYKLPAASTVTVKDKETSEVFIYNALALGASGGAGGSNGNSGIGGAGGPNTSDNNNVNLWVYIAIISAFGLVVSMTIRYRRKIEQ